MARKLNFGIGEYYHIYNRGVDKRDIFLDDKDLERFKRCMEVLNTVTPIGSLRDLPRDLVSGEAPLVDFIAHHLLPNHYHFILRQRVEDGIPRFMHRIGVAHTMYFNERYKREGVLFQGTYKAKHIDSNHYLLHASVYVNLNDRIHDTPSKLTRSSWKEYTDGSVSGLCKKEVILGQFSSPEAYAVFCEKMLLRPEVERPRTPRACRAQIRGMRQPRKQIQNPNHLRIQIQNRPSTPTRFPKLSFGEACRRTLSIVFSYGRFRAVFEILKWQQ